MTRLNWCLAVFAAVVWIGPVAWYFRNDIKTYRVRRHDKWFRQD